MRYSVVIPVYKSEKTIEPLYIRIKNTFEEIPADFEIIMVEDGGPDHSWEEIVKLCKKDKRVNGIRLSRNFGQHHAITAGLDNAKGDWCIVMDCDLQDQPEDIIKLIKKAEEGYDIVLASRSDRKDNFIKKAFSSLFYSVLTYLSGTEQDKSVANFGIYHKKTIASINSLRESIRYFPTMIRWIGFKRTTVEVEHAERTSGKTSYTYKKLINLALDIILAYSDKPLRLMITTGLCFSFLSLCLTVFIFILYLNGEIIVTGYTSLIISIWFLSGIIISFLGIVGLYVGKTFEGIKNRPLYVIDQKLNIT